MSRTTQGRFLVSGLPSGVPLWLHVDTIRPYTLDIDPGTTGLPAAVPTPAAPDVTLTLDTDAPAVAAYWSAGQTVTGTLTLASTGAATPAPDPRLGDQRPGLVHRLSVRTRSSSRPAPRSRSP